MLPQWLRSCADKLLLARLVSVRVHDRLLKPCIYRHRNRNGRYMLSDVGQAARGPAAWYVNSELNVWVSCSNFDYTCHASASSGQSLIECTTAWSAAEIVLQGVTVVTDGEVGTTTTATEPSNTITAYGIQVRFKSSDPTPVPVIDDPVSAL